MSSLLDTLKWHAEQKPADVAVSDGGGTELSFGVLPAHIEEVVVQLTGYIIPGRPVAIVCDNGPAWVLIDLALVKLGIPQLPLPSFFTPQQMQHAVTECGASILISDHFSDADELEGEIAILGKSFFISITGVEAKSLHKGTAKITFTSGTTGTPKGVCLSQVAMENTASSIVGRVGADAAHRHMSILPLPVLLENVAGLYATLIAGGSYIVPSQAHIGFGIPFQADFSKLAAALKSLRIRSIILVPEILRGLVAYMQASRVTLPDLALIAVGGAKISLSLLEQARAMGLPVLEGYGLSEASSVVSINMFDDNLLGSVGRPLPHLNWSLSKQNELVLDQAPFLGYVGAEPHKGPYFTGDIVDIDAKGRLSITGRARNVIINSFGRNIAPEWVESELTEQPEIAQALVFGEAMPSLGAILVPNEPSISETDIKAAINRTNARLPAYAHITNWFLSGPFTVQNGLLTGTGRPRRDAIMKEKNIMITKILSALDQSPTFFERLVNETEMERQNFMSVPIIQSGLKGEISHETYVAYLAQAYHHVKHTVPLMGSVKSRVPSHRIELHDALLEYIDEEHGHENWILNDIRHAGGNADEVKSGDPLPATELMVAYAYDYVARVNPIGFFGMVFVLEGTSTALATQAAEKIMERLDLKKKCFSYLLSHGSLDLEHMDFFEKLMGQITDRAEQDAIIHMAKVMYGLFADVFRSVSVKTELKDAA